MNPRILFLSDCFSTRIPETDADLEIRFTKETGVLIMGDSILLKEKIEDLAGILMIAAESPYAYDPITNTILDVAAQKYIASVTILLPRCSGTIEYEDKSTKKLDFGKNISDFLRTQFRLSITK